MSENTESCGGSSRFAWNELLTTDADKAKAFYEGLFGWKAEAFGDMGYSLLKDGDTAVGGLIKAPDPSLPAQWLAYVTVEDTDASAAKVTKLGGKVVMDPKDIPTVGRIAVVVDPLGAAFGLFQPLK